jgi:glutamine synthetase
VRGIHATVNSYKAGAQGARAISPGRGIRSYGSITVPTRCIIACRQRPLRIAHADGAVNPYLAAALVLAAGLEGIREGLDPGNPNEDNLYDISEAERAKRGIEFLPQTLQEAVAAFAADPLVEQALGKELKDEFIRYKTAEWEEYHLKVSQWEVERYSYMF